MAAAPDLLEACEAMIEDYETGKSVPAYEIREMARAAITKATTPTTQGGEVRDV